MWVNEFILFYTIQSCVLLKRIHTNRQTNMHKAFYHLKFSSYIEIKFSTMYFKSILTLKEFKEENQVICHDDLLNQRLSRACIVHLVIKKNNWSYVKTMSCSGSQLGITINIKNTKFVKDLPMIDA